MRSASSSAHGSSLEPSPESRVRLAAHRKVDRAPCPLPCKVMTLDGSLEARVRIALRWRDMDMLGHLNQAVYHELLEEGRGALLQSLGEVGSFPFVLARVELDYRHEVRHGDGHVDVVTRVARVGRKSITVAQEILLPDGTPAATGSSVLVAWDRHARGARDLTDGERGALLAA
jgi:acyl-CoA thioester hydrolase